MSRSPVSDVLVFGTHALHTSSASATSPSTGAGTGSWAYGVTVKPDRIPIL